MCSVSKLPRNTHILNSMIRKTFKSEFYTLLWNTTKAIWMLNGSLKNIMYGFSESVMGHILKSSLNTVEPDLHYSHLSETAAEITAGLKFKVKSFVSINHVFKSCQLQVCLSMCDFLVDTRYQRVKRWSRIVCLNRPCHFKGCLPQVCLSFTWQCCVYKVWVQLELNLKVFHEI